MNVPSTRVHERSTGWMILTCVTAWAIPGWGHLMLRRGKGAVFFVVLHAMFAIGLVLGGQLFTFEHWQPLHWAFAELGVGMPYLLARSMAFGGGHVTAWSYEYGNTFLIVAGLLNMLVVLDAWDIAVGKK